MLHIKNLHKSYGAFEVLRGLEMNVNTGDIYGFLGKNGCGKTTTMNIVSNIIPKDSGEINFGKENCKIGYLPETPSMFTYMNGYEYLDYIASCCSYKDDKKKRIDEVINIVGMAEGGKRRIKGYSRGMNQRLGIAAAIFDHPDLLILDEPINGLDPQGIAEIRNTILKLNRENGKTIIISSHILEELSKIATHYGIIDSGKLIAELTPEELSGKCESRIVIKVYDMEAACNLLHSINIHKFNIIDANTIHVYEHIEDSCQINMALCKADIFVSSIWVEQAGLEEFFFNMTGGGKNA